MIDFELAKKLRNANCRSTDSQPLEGDTVYENDRKEAGSICHQQETEMRCNNCPAHSWFRVPKTEELIDECLKFGVKYNLKIEIFNIQDAGCTVEIDLQDGKEPTRVSAEALDEALANLFLALVEKYPPEMG